MRVARPAPTSGLHTEQAPPLDLPFRFMATALAWLALLALLYPWATPLLLGSFYSPRLTAFVHANTLGIVGATILGASYQLLPVVLQRPLGSVRLARLSWWLYLPGVLAFAAGLSQAWPAVLATGGVLLFAAFALYVGIVAATLRRVPERDVVFWHVVAAVVGLAVATSLGVLLALSKFAGFLGGLTLPILAAHVTLMLGGWVTPMLAGVAYRLVGMFTLSEDRLRPGWAWAALVLASGGSWLLAASLLLGLGPVPAAGGAAALLAGVTLVAAQLVRLYRLRRRRGFDVHIPFVLASMAFGVLAASLTLVGLVTQRPVADPLWVAVGWWAIVGWAETAIQGFLYKIGTFLTWLHRYAPLAGRQPVPRLEELYGRRTALFGWASWTTGVALAGLAALGSLAWLVPFAAVGLSLGAAAFLANAVRVGSHWRTSGRRADANPSAVSAAGSP